MGNFLEKIESVRDAFKAGLYEPALALALTLPDICAKIEHQSMSSARGYIEWCDAHIFTSQSTDSDVSFTGAALYQLRCSFLHNGDNTIYKNEGKTWKDVKIQVFELMKPKNEHRNELMLKIETWKDTDTDTGDITYKAKMNMQYIIDLICNASEEFYDSWQEKDDFDDHVVNILSYSS